MEALIVALWCAAAVAIARTAHDVAIRTLAQRERESQRTERASQDAEQLASLENRLARFDEWRSKTDRLLASIPLNRTKQ